MGEVFEMKLKGIEEQGDNVGRYSKILPKIIDHHIPVHNISECTKEGDIIFTITMDSLGVSRDVFWEHTGEIFSPFVADFLGELIIRTNLDKFTDKLTRMHHDSFVYAVKGGETETCHKRFGMKVKDGMISFRFHISLLHEILTEDFRQVMG
tara:strand:+ start:1665 stop:2120 length:456 start_codon:yes stop_codon:yes gene_type:complete